MNKRQIGSVYELKASDYLTKKGYQIIERNYRCRIGEIDIIAIERDCLCFIEVKYRKNEKTGDPLEAVINESSKKLFGQRSIICLHIQNIKVLNAALMQWEYWEKKFGLSGMHFFADRSVRVKRRSKYDAHSKRYGRRPAVN